MKTILIALLVSLTWSTAADDFAKLKTIRRDMIAKAMQPINDSYKREIQRLLDDALRAKNLDLANKCRDELASIEMLGTWNPKTNEGFQFCFMDDGAVVQIGGGQAGKWKAKEGKLRFNLNVQAFEVDLATKKGTIVNEGKTFPVELVRSK